MFVTLIVVAAFIGALIYWYGAYPMDQQMPFFEKGNEVSGQNQNSNTAPEQQAVSPKEISLPETASSVDGAVDAVIKSASVDQATASSEDSDSSLLNSDSKDITDFGQSYNENNY
jgi:hypothetical protein